MTVGLFVLAQPASQYLRLIQGSLMKFFMGQYIPPASPQHSDVVTARVVGKGPFTSGCVRSLLIYVPLNSSFYVAQ